MLELMHALGVQTVNEAHRLIVPAPQRYTGRDLDLHPDPFMAGCLLSATTIVGGRLRLEGMTPRTRASLADLLCGLDRLGVQVSEQTGTVELERPADTRLAAEGILPARDRPTAALLATVSLFAEGPVMIEMTRPADSLDAGDAAGLGAVLQGLGVRSEVTGDRLVIVPLTRPPGMTLVSSDATVNAALALAGLRWEGFEIKQPDRIEAAFPEYFDRISMLRG
jgi:5-enolpyruvylshikimate-3-phosphate synthase